ncbi:MAG TPA: hypothetical protein PLR81_07845 [Treponemataceae bacterium]|nr:hypothetical protein [Treponemataceae bacterium]
MAMTQEEQIKYWEEFQTYYKEQKKKIQKKISEKEKEENAKNKKKINHATFVLFGEMIKHDGIKNFIAKLAEPANNSFSEKEKDDINLLLKARKIDVVF